MAQVSYGEIGADACPLADALRKQGVWKHSASPVFHLHRQWDFHPEKHAISYSRKNFPIPTQFKSKYLFHLLNLQSI